MIFRWTHVLCVLALDLRLHMIESVWGLDLLDIAYPWDNPTFPKGSLQSIGWIGRSIGWKFEFDPRALFCSCPVLIGLTGQGHRSDRCWSTVSFRGDLSGTRWLWLEKARVKFSSSLDSVCSSFGSFLGTCPRRSDRPCTPVSPPLTNFGFLMRSFGYKLVLSRKG